MQAAMDSRVRCQADRCLTEQPACGGIVEMNGRRWINLASNDYLDLARHPQLAQAASEAATRHGTGATASRLVTGTLALHHLLEEQLATHKGYPAALLYGSGYMANAGVLPALVGRGDHVFADRLIHASVIDAVRLSGARLHRFAHNEPDALDALLTQHPHDKRIVCVESVYSMDGDLAPLDAFAEVIHRHEVMWMVDEAHAGGIFGPRGAGCIAARKLQPDVTVAIGTLSKAFGGYGGFAACSEVIRNWLINNSRAFIYTTAPPPPTVAAALAALDLVHDNVTWGATLLQRAERFRQRLQAAGLDTMTSRSQIIPVRAGTNDRALRLAAFLQKESIIVGAMRPPTVPAGSARLRLSLSLAHSESDLDHVADVLIAAGRREGLC